MRFPIQADRRSPWNSQAVLGPESIEWEQAAFAYESYHRLYPSQTLERLAERGGFGWIEYLALCAATRFMRENPRADGRAILDVLHRALAV